ncbi:hypothetical protein [Aquimonas sp.]|jgi:hypothetical protein|uniref:hypothetical protein n=1 Tax=Aquimonas sp. TaxID=1872588 RepID=UPI0037C1258D
MTRSIALAVVISIGWHAAVFAQAQDNTKPDETRNTSGVPNGHQFYGSALKTAENLGALSEGLFGERVSLATGSVEFSNTDVQIPTNGQIPITLGRRSRIGEDRWFGDSNYFHASNFGYNWMVDAPHIRGNFHAVDGWVTSEGVALGNPGRRCSVGNFAPPRKTGPWPYHHTTWISAHNYWGGNIINIPEAGEERMLSMIPGSPRPSDGRSYYGVTKSAWVVSCLPAILNGPGEGFRVTLPNGNSYNFNWMAVQKAKDLDDGTTPKEALNNAITGSLGVPRVAFFEA